NPRMVVVVTVNGTHGETGFGAYSAGPAFKRVATEALRVFDVPKDVPLPAKPVMVTEAKQEDADDLTASDLEAGETNILEEPDEDEAASVAVMAAAPGPKVPDFKGKTMRAVLAEAAAKG